MLSGTPLDLTPITTASPASALTSANSGNFNSVIADEVISEEWARSGVKEAINIENPLQWVFQANLGHDQYCRSTRVCNDAAFYWLRGAA